MLFASIHSIFNALLVISTVLVLVVFATFIKLRKNGLLLICCGLILALNVLLFAGWFGWNNDIPFDDGFLDNSEGGNDGSLVGEDDDSSDITFCSVQGWSLNYILLSIQALVAFMMLDSFLYAVGWKLRTNEAHHHHGHQQPTIKGNLVSGAGGSSNVVVGGGGGVAGSGTTLSFPWYYILPSFAIPLLPTSLAIFYPKDYPVKARAFFCYFYRPLWATTTSWSILFSAFGVIFTAIIIRYESIQAGRTTHITRGSILRIGLATFSYSLLALAGFLPSCFDSFQRPEFQYRGLTRDLTNPYKNPDLCSAEYANSGSLLGVWAYLRCPGVSTFAPCMVGLGLFCMYGLGEHARQVYYVFFRKLFRLCTCSASKSDTLDKNDLEMQSVACGRKPSMDTMKAEKRTESFAIQSMFVSKDQQPPISVSLQLNSAFSSDALIELKSDISKRRSFSISGVTHPGENQQPPNTSINLQIINKNNTPKHRSIDDLDDKGSNNCNNYTLSLEEPTSTHHSLDHLETIKEDCDDQNVSSNHNIE